MNRFGCTMLARLSASSGFVAASEVKSSVLVAQSATTVSLKPG
jgi:hypothetical protein